MSPDPADTFRQEARDLLEALEQALLDLSQDHGNRDLVEFDTFFDRSIFRPGYSEWGASFGIRSGFGERAPEYYEDEYVGSAFYRRGFEGGLTAGWNAQFDNQSSLVGAEVLKATNFGVLSADLAVSSQDNHGEGYALDIDFTRSPAFAPGDFRPRHQ